MMSANDFTNSLKKIAAEILPEGDKQQEILQYLEEQNFWEVAKAVGAFYNTPGTSEGVIAECRDIINDIRGFQGLIAETSETPTTVVFGTSGWRGVIGKDFTCYNVAKVVRGIIEMMQTEIFLKTNKYSSFTEVQKNGIIIFRDNRFMGNEFINTAIKELAAANIKMYIAGECPTGVGSALVTELSAAGSINFTPSHNPMDYAGLKFNPADGGPAGPELTSVIEEKANRYMQPGETFIPSTADTGDLLEHINAPAIFTNFVATKSKVFNLDNIRNWLNENINDIALVVDFMHGSSRGYIEKLLGDDLVHKMREAGSIHLLNTNDDYSFHGIKPEPCAANQAPLIELLKKMDRKFNLAVALDPDADRIRFADAEMDVDMNRFGPIAYAGLLARGIDGGIASTAPTSDFALEIAKKEGKEIVETEVGFKNFREALSTGKVVLAFEESDGITCTGHTLEKCALAGLLLALESMIFSGKNISQQYTELRAKYGYFYPAKAGADVKGVSVDEWQAYKKEVVDTLQHKLFKVGDKISIAGIDKEISSINIIDGLKVIFPDRSWILLRPSGTEPKFRYYFELAAETPLMDEAGDLKAYEKAAAGILQKARDIVENN